MIDPGRFTADYEASLAFPALPYLTLRIPTMAVWHSGEVLPLARSAPSTAPSIAASSARQRLGDARYYHGLTFPMVL